MGFILTLFCIVLSCLSPLTSDVSENNPPDFDGVNPDFVLHCLKLLKSELLAQIKAKAFYKLYSIWQKLSEDQWNKTLSYFRKLPAELRGLFIIFYYLFLLSILLFYHFIFFSYCIAVIY
jgi:hypothetical protein